MNTFQKIIKALAIALAVFIMFTIVSVIIGTIGAIAKVRFLTDIFTVDETEVISFSQTYDIEQITNLKIETSVSKLQILESDKFSVDAKDVTEKFSAVVENGTLVIKEKAKTNISINGQVEPMVTLYIPEGFVFENVSIETGVGDTYIKSIQADAIDISLGVGNLGIDFIDAKREIDIHAGVGRIDIENSVLSNLEFEAGVGEYDITTCVMGNSKFECGVGTGNITLNDFNEESHKIKIEKGLGDITINNQSYSDNQTYGNGTDLIEIEGGVGKVSITLN